MYITRLASKEIFSPSNKIHWEGGWAKDLSAPRYVKDTCFYILSSVLRIPCHRLLLQMLMFAQLVWYPPLLVGPKGILSRWHQFVNGAYPESTKSNPYIHTKFLQGPFHFPKPYNNLSFPASLCYASLSHLWRECCDKTL